MPRVNECNRPQLAYTTVQGSKLSFGYTTAHLFSFIHDKYTDKIPLQRRAMPFLRHVRRKHLSFEPIAHPLTIAYYPIVDCLFRARWFHSGSIISIA